MSKYRFFKIGEEIQYLKGIKIVDDFIIEIKPELYQEEFETLIKEFGDKPITNLTQADDFIIFLSSKRINADFMEYCNVMA